MRTRIGDVQAVCVRWDVCVRAVDRERRRTGSKTLRFPAHIDAMAAEGEGHSESRALHHAFGLHSEAGSRTPLRPLLFHARRSPVLATRGMVACTQVRWRRHAPPPHRSRAEPPQLQQLFLLR